MRPPLGYWTVGELRERLDDFGDHVPVKVVIERGNGTFIRDFDITASSDPDLGFFATIEVDLN